MLTVWVLAWGVGLLASGNDPTGYRTEAACWAAADAKHAALQRPHSPIIWTDCTEIEVPKQ